MCDPSYKARQNEVQSETTSKFAVQAQASKLASPALASCQQDEGVHPQTIRSWVIGSNDVSCVRGILDGGSQRNYIKEYLVAKLALKVVGETSLAVNAFTSAATLQEQRNKVVELRLRSQFGDAEHRIQAITVPTACLNVPNTDMNGAFAIHLRKLGYRLADVQTVPQGSGDRDTDLLIGADQLRTIVAGEVIRSKQQEGLVAITTSLGWTLQGPISKRTPALQRTTGVTCALSA